MARLAITTTLSILFLLLAPGAATASEVRAGGLRAPIVDGIAVAGDFFGKNSVMVYLFAEKVEPGVEAVLASKHFLGLTIQGVAEEIGVTPVLELMLFFDPSTRACSVSGLLSYTAVFQMSEAFPFDVAVDDPVNFADGTGNHGISVLDCGFQHGSPIRIRISDSWNAEREMFPALFKPGRNEMLFTWDLDFEGYVVRAKAFPR